jgi:hypothetical protein
MHRHIVLAVVMLSATVAPVFAQEVYLVGGGGATFRAPGWYPSQATPSAPGASTVLSIGGGAGVWLAPNLAVEGSIGMATAQSIDWFYGYPFNGTGGRLTNDRDVPLTGLFRIAPLRRRAASLEPVVGGGVTFHRGATFSTSDCGTSEGPPSASCVTITPPQLDEIRTFVEPLLTAGADLALRASRRVAIAPGFRVNYARRPLYMTSSDFRGPASGAGFFSTVCVTVRYSLR